MVKCEDEKIFKERTKKKKRGKFGQKMIKISFRRKTFKLLFFIFNNQGNKYTVKILFKRKLEKKNRYLLFGTFVVALLNVRFSHKTIWVSQFPLVVDSHNDFPMHPRVGYNTVDCLCMWDNDESVSWEKFARVEHFWQVRLPLLKGNECRRVLNCRALRWGTGVW